MRVQLPSSAIFDLSFLFFVGALTSKTYAFQYRAWELRSHVSTDEFDLSNPPIKLQFFSSTILRILPLSTSSLPWLSDLVRFNFPYSFNLCQKAFSVSFTFSKRLVYKFFGDQVYMLRAFFEFLMPLRSLVVRPSSYLLSIFKSDLVQSFTHFIFHSFNLREFSPSLLASLRVLKNSTFMFFSSFFDFGNLSNRSFFFPNMIFSSTFFSLKTYVALKLNFKTSICFSKHSFKNFVVLNFIQNSFGRNANFSSRFSLFFQSELFCYDFETFPKFTFVKSTSSSKTGVLSDFFFFKPATITDLPSLEKSFSVSKTQALLFPAFNFFNYSIYFYHSQNLGSEYFSFPLQLFIAKRRVLNTPYSSLYNYRRTGQSSKSVI